MNKSLLGFLKETPSGLLVGATNNQSLNLVLAILALPISLGLLILHHLNK